MDLTGYGYRRSVLRQEIPEVTTSAVQKSEALSAELSGEALRLLIKVNTKVALQELSVRFPSVLNRIADVWRHPAQAERCFDELLLNSRGKRQGFPQPVLSEIASLRHYYLTRVFPKRIDPWEEVARALGSRQACPRPRSTLCSRRWTASRESHAVRRSGGQVRLAPLERAERLTALIPPPSLHRQRYQPSWHLCTRPTTAIRQ